ncbi:MAG: AAA family ATPase [Myxococcales bacterium]|nr:AAA family ATPase [Myxococcales bacterium]
MTITAITLEKFTAFESLEFEPSTGVNVLIGANGTGKTHLMKVAYAACDITRTREGFGEKLVGSFLPSGGALGRLVRRRGTSSAARVVVRRGDLALRAEFSSHAKDPSHANVKVTAPRWSESPVESVFVPVKEMLANAPGFRSLYARREIHFESVYADIIDRAYLPLLRGPRDDTHRGLLSTLQGAMDGKVVVKNEEFFLKNAQGELEFTLLAEGLRKLGLLWLLIQNGTLAGGSVLFWDEPETNLNPQLFSVVVELLLGLQRLGVQVFVTTHDYGMLKEFELAARPGDHIRYHACFRPEGTAAVEIETSDTPSNLANSPIAAAMTSLYDREVRRSLGRRA